MSNPQTNDRPREPNPPAGRATVRDEDVQDPQRRPRTILRSSPSPPDSPNRPNVPIRAVCPELNLAGSGCPTSRETPGWPGSFAAASRLVDGCLNVPGQPGVSSTSGNRYPPVSSSGQTARIEHSDDSGGSGRDGELLSGVVAERAVWVLHSSSRNRRSAAAGLARAAYRSSGVGHENILITSCSARRGGRCAVGAVAVTQFEGGRHRPDSTQVA